MQQNFPRYDQIGKLETAVNTKPEMMCTRFIASSTVGKINNPLQQGRKAP